MLDKKKRDSMVVMLEGYPEEDVDATMSKEEADSADSVEEAMEMAEGQGPLEMAKTGLQDMIDNWKPETEEGESYLRDVQDLLAQIS
jgi:hypothetical protein